MKRTLCIVCKQIIRRPIDHFNCPGIMDNWFLEVKEFIPNEREITKEIKIPRSKLKQV